MILTDLCKKDFLKENAFATQLLPEYLKNLVIYRWFNLQTKISIDFLNWEDDGFDYGVSSPNSNLVYSARETSGNRSKDFDKILAQALLKANLIYNQENK